MRNIQSRGDQGGHEHVYHNAIAISTGKPGLAGSLSFLTPLVSEEQLWG